MLRVCLTVAAILTTTVARADSARTLHPIAAGKYCANEPVTGATGTGQEVKLGNFLMVAQVNERSGRYAISVSDQMPDTSQILEVATKHASVLGDGSLAFRLQMAGTMRGGRGYIAAGKLSSS